jgi:hypothetical protein
MASSPWPSPPEEERELRPSGFVKALLLHNTSTFSYFLSRKKRLLASTGFVTMH